MPLRPDFFVSDTHFGHANIIRYCDRPFHSVGQMDAELVTRWNTVVSPDDVVLHLGDLALGRIEDSLAVSAQLNGKKYLIPGNHDRVSPTTNKPAYVERFTPVYEAAGWTILPEIIDLTIGGHDVVVSHYPYAGDSHDNDRYTGARPIDAGRPLVHGHVHDQWDVRSRQFNVSVEVRDYAPTPVGRIREWLDS